jgi:beta-glucosidase
VVGFDYLDEGEYTGVEMSGPWTEHFPKPSEADTPTVQLSGAFSAVRKTSAYGGDRESLTLHPEDEQLIDAIAAANPRTVVAILAGSAVIAEAWRDKVAAILMLWYPGQEGGHAFADVLLGRVNPSGKLPSTFPAGSDGLPLFDMDATAITYDLWHGYRKLERDRIAPAYPFGFGLSYTTFELSALHLAQDTIGHDGAIVATLDVTNTGDMAGEEVVQLYVGARSSAVERAPKELKAFIKVRLEPGQTRTIHLAVPASQIAYYDETTGGIVEPGHYEVIVGRHSLDEQALRTHVTIR